MTKIFSTNGRVQGDRNFGFSIIPGSPMVDQVKNQIGGVDAAKDEVVILHPIPGVGASTVAFLRGRNNDFPTIALVGPDGVNKGEVDLHSWRHNSVRPMRKAFLDRNDEVAENAVIIVNSSGREVPEHQIEELKQLTGKDQLVVATLQLGQIDLAKPGLATDVLNQLVQALGAAGVGRSIASRPVVAITAGLCPVNAIIVTALHGLCESWCSQPVAENRDGVFHFVDLFKLANMEDLGRAATAATAPVTIPRNLFDRIVSHLATNSETEEAEKIFNELNALVKS